MKGWSLLLAIGLLATHGACGDPAASSTGTFGVGAGVPLPSESVSSDGHTITVDESFGDRMFTTVTSRYDAKTFQLLSSERHASCCGAYWKSSIERNGDASYDIESKTFPPSRDGKDFLLESRPHFETEANRPLIAGSLLFVPWLYHATHSNDLVRISFDPLRTDYIIIADVPGAPYPDGVPSHDKALSVTSISDRPTTMWYDPCTFIVDAYGNRGGSVTIRTALVKSGAFKF